QRRIRHCRERALPGCVFPPSVREFGDAGGLSSPSSVAHQRKVLQRKGYLHRDQNRPRAVELRRPGRSGTTEFSPEETGDEHSTSIPLLGRIAAGGPILAEESVEEVFSLPRRLVGEGRLFMLTVVG